MSSPTERGGLTSFPPIDVPVFAEDGRRVHRLRQSSMKDLDICLERARRNMTGLMPSVGTDATGIGTAVHGGIEYALLLEQQGEYPPIAEVIEHAQELFTGLIAEPGFKWVQKQEKGARVQISRCLMSWDRMVRDTLVPQLVEESFGPLVLHEDEHRIIEVVGTIDYLDAETGLGDWKTASRLWEPWEHERWDLQPTTYIWAAVESGWIDLTPKVPFTFYVFVKGNPVTFQRITVERHAGDFAWLKERAVSIAKLIEAGLDEWPKNDNSALCGPKFCPAWDTCKGKHYAEGWPKPSEPASKPACEDCEEEDHEAGSILCRYTADSCANCGGYHSSVEGCGDEL